MTTARRKAFRHGGRMLRARRILGALGMVAIGTVARAETTASGEDQIASDEAAATEFHEAGATTEARDAFRLGSVLAKQGQWSEALSAFQRSAELRPHPVTAYDIGYCQRALGRPASAYESFSVALDWDPRDAALPPDVAAQARAFLAEAESRIVRVSVTLPRPGLSFRVDGAPLGPFRGDEKQSVFLVRAQGAGAVALPAYVELWLDPGAHVFVLTHEDGARAVENRSFASGVHEAIRFEAPVSRVRPPEPVAPPPAGPPDRTAAWVSFGVAAAGLTTSAVFAGLALGDRHTLTSDPRCTDRVCPDEPEYDELRERMLQSADIATVSLVVAGAAAGLGTYFWLTARPREDAARGSAGIRARAFVGLGGAGVIGRF